MMFPGKHVLGAFAGALFLWTAAGRGAEKWTPPKIPAFPGAEGYGAVSKGGRGGKVIKVTNLNPKGPGSLQWACDQEGPRIIVFEVSGVIKPPNSSKGKRWLSVRRGRVTIAGQTAPGAGITIEGMLSTSRSSYATPKEKRPGRKALVPDVIVRFLRVRPCSGKGNLRTLETRASRRIIFDHVSGSWSTDQCFNAGGIEDLTFQWCGIEESDMSGLEGSKTHGYALFGSYNETGNTTVHHCLLAHHTGRNPDFDENYNVDFRNNVLYNLGFAETVMRWFNRAKTPNRPFAMFNLVGNTWRTGPGGILGSRSYMPPPSALLRGFVPTDSTGRFWFEGNRFDWEGHVGMEQYSGGRAKYAAKKPFPMPPVRTHTADEAYELICAHGGCLPRDAVSARTIAEVRTRTGEWGRHGADGGLMEGLTPGKAPLDTDNDGMPDAWEKLHKLNPKDPADNNKLVPAGASPGDRHKGYTWIEYYINDCADRLVAAALTRARLDRTPAKPWDKPATALSADAAPYKSLDEIVKAIHEQNAERDKDPRKRWHITPGWLAVQQLDRMGAKAAPAVPKLIPGLRKGLADQRSVAFAAWALGAIGPAAKEAVPELIKALKCPQNTKTGKLEFRVYGFLAWALGRIGLNEEQAKEAVPVLAGLMHGPDRASRANAAWVLSRMGKTAEPAMAKLLQALGKQRGHRASALSTHAARALANIGAPAVDGLIKALGSREMATRADAARALGWMEPATAMKAVPTLIARVKSDPEPVVRMWAADALVRIASRNGGAVAALASGLSDKAYSVRVSAATALGRCGPAASNSVPAMARALGDKRREVKRAAALALGKVGKAALPALEKALAGGDPFVRKYAARALGTVGKDAAGATGALVKALSDKDAEVRREVVWSLALIGKAAGSASGALESAAKKDADYVVRYAAGAALKKVRK